MVGSINDVGREASPRTQCVDEEKSPGEDSGEGILSRRKGPRGKGHKVGTHSVGWRNEAGEGIEASQVMTGMTANT